MNILSYMPLNPIMSYVMGLEGGEEPSRETRPRWPRCHRLMKEGLEAGGCGWSSQMGANDVQRDYDGTLMITNLMTEGDLLSFARVLREVGRGFIQCIGASQELTEKLADESGRPVIWNVLAVFTDQHGIAMPGHESAMKWLDECNARGTRIFGQALTGGEQLPVHPRGVGTCSTPARPGAR